VIAVTCVSATIRPSLPLCPRPPSTLSLCPKFRALDPRPRPPAPRDVHANDRPALLWVRRTPNDFCNCTSDARTHSRASVSRENPSVPRSAVNSDPPSLLAVLFTARRPSPVEEGSRKLRAVTTPSKPPLLRCKLAAGYCLECHRPIATLLAGNASIRPPFAAMAVGRQRWIARAK
jgi:hypothetical protein